MTVMTCACNFSTLFTCSRSGSPQNVMHSSSIFIVTHLGIGSVFQHQVSSSSRPATLQTGRAARVLTISDHVMYNFRTSTWVNLVTPILIFWRPFFKMAATEVKGQIYDGPIERLQLRHEYDVIRTSVWQKLHSAMAAYRKLLLRAC